MTLEQALESAIRFSQAGQLEQAESLFRQIASARPNDAQSHYNLGRVLAQRGDLSAAIASYERSLRLQPRFPEALNNLGELLRQKGELDQAVRLLREATALRPGFVEAHYNLSLVLSDQDHFDEALREVRLVLKLLPNSPDAYNHLGNLCRQQNRPDDAIAAYQRALELRPGFAEARWHLALALLLKGDFIRGWQGYDARRQIPSVWRDPGLSQPLWDGADLAGRRLLLWAEQGFGDTIQFIRYVPRVRARGGGVIVLCQPELRRLLQSQTWIDRLCSFGEALPEFDVQCPLLDLPRLFATTLSTIPAKVPYLTADPALVEAWRPRMKSGRNNVGLVWSTKPAAPGSEKRSVGLHAMAELAQIPGTTYWSLQTGEAAVEAKSSPPAMELIDCSGDLHDFADTAALIANLDLVIACDTAVAHLAGAMGMPVWVALPHVSPWRWLLDRTDSPWYPTARLFRQERPGDWSAPVQAIACCLAEFSA